MVSWLFMKPLIIIHFNYTITDPMTDPITFFVHDQGNTPSGLHVAFSTFLLHAGLTFHDIVRVEELRCYTLVKPCKS